MTTKQYHYFADDGSYGNARGLYIAETSDWSDEQWEAIDEASDYDRHEIASDIASENGSDFTSFGDTIEILNNPEAMEAIEEAGDEILSEKAMQFALEHFLSEFPYDANPIDVFNDFDDLYDAGEIVIWEPFENQMLNDVVQWIADLQVVTFKLLKGLETDAILPERN